LGHQSWKNINISNQIIRQTIEGVQSQVVIVNISVRIIWAGEGKGSGFLAIGPHILWPPAQHFHLVAVNGEGPCSGKIANSVLDFLSKSLYQADELGTGSGVKNKPDLFVR
jgi:hypothetical protein